jgi:hypothetical protein
MSETCRAGDGLPVCKWHLCQQDAHLLAGACLGKSRFRVPEAAHRARIAHTGRGGFYRTYQCPVCSAWHNGRTVAGNGEDQADVVRRLRAAGNAWVIEYLAAEWAGLGRADRQAWKSHPSGVVA